METQYKYIHFVLRERKPGIKTDSWDIVNNKSNDVIGTIKWYGAWRQYCFYTMGGCIFNTGCLKNIDTFINKAMHEWKSAWLMSRWRKKMGIDGEETARNKIVAEAAEGDPGEEHEDECLRPCIACGGWSQRMGQLGDLIHYRCRDCGLEHSHKA